MDVAVGMFKTKCLRLMEDVRRTRHPLLITKRGRPLVRVVPVAPEKPGVRFGALRGSVRFAGDVTAPLGDSWSVDE